MINYISTSVLDKIRQIRDSFYHNVWKKPRIYYNKLKYLENYVKNNKKVFRKGNKFLRPYRRIRVFNANTVEVLKNKIKAVI